MAQVERVCQQCNNSFLFRDVPSNTGKGKFCSPTCQHLFRHRDNKTIQIACEFCQKTFTWILRPSSRVKRKFCSMKCTEMSRAGRERKPWQDRMDKNIVRGPNETDCWIWTGAKNDKGYGQMSIVQNGKSIKIYTHRLMWERVYGPIPEGLEACHKCDTPLCCSVDHLFLGSHKENMNDAVKKGRNHHGERHRFAKFTDQQVIEIRSLYPALNQKQITKRFHVSRSAIMHIVRGEHWKHLL